MNFMQRLESSVGLSCARVCQGRSHTSKNCIQELIVKAIRALQYCSEGMFWLKSAVTVPNVVQLRRWLSLKEPIDALC